MYKAGALFLTRRNLETTLNRGGVDNFMKAMDNFKKEIEQQTQPQNQAMIKKIKNNKEKKYWVKSEYEKWWVMLFVCLSPIAFSSLFTYIFMHLFAYFLGYNYKMMFVNNRLIVETCIYIAILLLLILRMKYYEFYDDLFVIKRLGLGKSKVVYYKNITDFQWHVGFAAIPDVLIIYHLENTKRIKEVLGIRHKKEALLIKNKLIEQGYDNIKFENL